MNKNHGTSKDLSGEGIASEPRTAHRPTKGSLFLPAAPSPGKRYFATDGDGVPAVVMDRRRLASVLAECGSRSDAELIVLALNAVALDEERS